MPAHSTHDAFRARVRDFFNQAVPDDIRAAVQSHCMLTREQVRRWHVILNAQGWAAPAWPKDMGGPGWSLAEQAIFKEELAAADVPNVENLGIDTIGPTLMRFGTPAQCAHFLPRMLRFDDYWAQAYSEPDAGSDLASLKTSATQDAEGNWIVNGSKIWQSMGHWANWAIVLVRTDLGAAKQQDGISVLLVDLTSPGVEVRPIKFITGGDFHAQIFFDNVRVPAQNMVGAPNAGWGIAKGLLVIERLFVARIGECKAELKHLLPLVQALPQDAHGLAIRHRLAELQIRMEAQEAAWWPALEAAERGESHSLQASLLKLDGVALLQELHLLKMDVLGAQALRHNPESVLGQPPAHADHAAGNAALGFWRYRGSSLAGGSTEVQQGIIAKTLMRGETDIHQRPDDGDDVGQMLSGLHSWLQHNDSRRTPPNAFASALWSVAKDMGVLAMAAPESAGGLACSPQDLLRAVETLGESQVREPLVWHNLLPAHVLAQLPQLDASCTQLLNGGRVALALPDLNRPTPLFSVRQQGQQLLLSGEHPLILGGGQSQLDLLVFTQHEDGIPQLWRVPAEHWSGHTFTLHDGRTASSCTLSGLPLHADWLLASGPDAQRAQTVASAFALLALSADSLGAARETIRQTLTFLSERRQFKRALIDFQVLQTRLVEHVRAWYRAKCFLTQVARSWAHAAPTHLADAHAVKYMAGCMARNLALDAPHLHGAMGYQDETPVSHYAKRLFANDVLLGNAHAQAAQRAAHI